MIPRVVESRLLTARTRRTVVKSVESGVVIAGSSSASDPTSSDGLQQPQPLSAKEVEKQKVKKIVDKVYTMDSAYGFIASKFTRMSLDDDFDGQDPRRARGHSRLTSRPRVSYRGLTGILSGRASVMSDYRATPKTPKLMYSSLLSLSLRR